MYAYAAVPLVCWLCALIAIPRKPRFGNEVEELVYARLLGRQQLPTLLAMVMTASAGFVLVVNVATASDPAADSRPRGGPQAATRIMTSTWDPRLVIDPRSGNG